MTLPIVGPKPWIVAHRGAAHACPENTLAAFDLALIEGAHAIELDLQLSADGHPVVFHDRTLEKAGFSDHRVAELTLAELEALDVGEWFSEEDAGTRISRLEEVLDRYGRKTCLILEIKAREIDCQTGSHLRLVERATDLVLARKLEDRVAWISYSADALAHASRLVPGIARVLNTGRPPRSETELLSICDGLSAVSTGIDELTPDLAEAVHSTGTPMLSFPIDTPEDASRAADAAVDGLLTQRPGWLATRLLERRVT